MGNSKKELRDLWRWSFGDTEAYMDYYFSQKAPVSDIYTKTEDGMLASMAFFTPYSVNLFGENKTAYYIVGVATEEKYRGQHRMTWLLQGAMAKYKDGNIQGNTRGDTQGDTPFFLCPMTPRVYTSLGFRPVYWRETTHIRPDYVPQGRCGSVKKWEELSFGECKKIIEYVNGKLKEEEFDLYIVRSIEYYRQVSLELQALEGNLYSIWDGKGGILAVANVIFEDGGYQVTELIADEGAGEIVIDTLLNYLHVKSLQIDDSYFLRNLHGMGIVREKQDKPYIMCRMLAGETPEIRCYINDIT